MSVTTSKRRLTAVIATAAFLPIALAACGSLEDNGDNGDGAADTDATDSPAGDDGASGDHTIVTVPKLTGISWFTRLGEGTDRYADDTGVDAYMQGSGQADANAQVRVIEDLLASNVDALAVVPFQPDAVEQVLTQAMSEDVVVITHEAPEIENADWDLEAFRNEDYGVNLMEQLATRMDGEGQYAMMVGSLSSATHMAWVNAARDYQEENYPDMEMVGDFVETSDDSQIAYERMQELLSAYPDLKGVQGSASTDVVGVGQAVEEAGLQDEIAVVGTSTANDARAGLESGAIDLITFWDPADAAYAMNVLAKAILDGEDVVDGMNLEAPGYETITIDGKVIYGDRAWIEVDLDNADEYDF